MSGSEAEHKEPHLVLSIDGGGFRGLACLIILAHLMTEISNENNEDTPKPCQIFDLICGTSTGGLIAVLLGRFGLSCVEAIEVFREVGATIFSGEADARKIWGHILEAGQLPSGMFEKKLEDLIEKYTGSKDALFRPLRAVPDSVAHDSTKTFVTVVSKIGSAGADAYRIRSYGRPPKDIDATPYGHKWTIFEAARGTCANPLYLLPLEIRCGHATFMFQDAAYSGFNNPATVAIDEAEKLFGPDTTIALVSVGTGLRSLGDSAQHGTETNKEIKVEHIDTFVQQMLTDVGDFGRSMQNAPELAKRLAKQYLEVATDTEISHMHAYERFRRRGQRHNYYRFNPPQGLGDVELTDYRQEATISLITDAWLKSPDGVAAISSAAEKLKNCWDHKRKRIDKARPPPADSSPQLTTSDPIATHEVMA